MEYMVEGQVLIREIGFRSINSFFSEEYVEGDFLVNLFGENVFQSQI